MSLRHICYSFVTWSSIWDWFVLVSTLPASSLINVTFIKPQNCTEFQAFVPGSTDLTARIASTLVGSATARCGLWWWRPQMWPSPPLILHILHSHGLCLKYASTAEKRCQKKRSDWAVCEGEQWNETRLHLRTPEAAWVCWEQSERQPSSLSGSAPSHTQTGTCAPGSRWWSRTASGSPECSGEGQGRRCSRFLYSR